MSRYSAQMRSVPAFLLVAVLVTLTPGPATATVIRVAARDGRRAALGAVLGNSAGVLVWGCLSAVGVSSLVLASEVAYTLLKVGGATVLVVFGLRSLLSGRRARPATPATAQPDHASGRGWRAGLATSVSNPKLAVFFVALFPQFLAPHTAVLPAALAMAGVIVAFDLIWYSALITAVHRIRVLVTPRLQRLMERVTGSVMVALGLRLAIEAR